MSTSRNKILDAMTVPLGGVNLVEANAGTGKTYNIVSLYLRLLLEASMTVDQILVVSFTEAATAELRDRVRQRLRKLQIVFETGSGEKEDLPFLACCESRAVGLRQIIRALQSFDQAAIYTIHGFCQRLLSDSAFEAGLSQSTALITDDRAYRRQLIEDFWHNETMTGSRRWVRYLVDNANPEVLEGQLSRYFSRPLLNKLSPPDPGASADLEESFSRLFATMRQDWLDGREEIADVLRNDPGLNQTKYKPAALETLFIELDDWILAGGPGFRGLTRLERLGAAKINKSINKDHVAPEHPFFELFQQLLDTGQQLHRHFDERLAAMRKRLLEYAERELPRIKRDRNVRHFDDLLGQVYQVLQTGLADSLRLAVAQRYHAALIDEFQDTDPLQFAIFDALFCSREVPVFFVGDPKQAIYAFRGADVYAYLDARGRAKNRYLLEQNFRSTPRLVDSINTIFQQTDNPFVIDDIDFHASAAAYDKPGLIIDGNQQPAMRWWFVPGADVKARTPTEVNRRIAEAVATEIAALLQLIGENRVIKPDGKVLQAGEIAVLVNSHAQGRIVRDELAQRGVACMQRTDENVFRTREARELYQVLRAVVEPSRYGLVRAALATELLGYDAREIDELEQADSRWQGLLDRFSAYPQTWRHHGFARVYRGIVTDFDVERRLLALSDGQRRVTNLMHLADLLQRESIQRQGRFDEILNWMQEQEGIKRPSDQTMLLRLDTDENLVNIMTIHFSKGLQFPVVFCPYLWSPGGSRSSDLLEFHDERNRPTLDLSADKDSVYKDQVAVEQLAERVRLAYVAMTRAELACWAVWGPMRLSKRSGLNWLLHARSSAGTDVAAAVKQMKIPTGAEVDSSLTSIATDAMTVGPLPCPTDEKIATRQSVSTRLSARVLKREVPRGWRVSSFSAMTRHVIEDPRDFDAGKSEDRPVVTEPEGIFAFPRGARAGRCMHALMENIEFGDDYDAIEEVARQILANHGFSTAQSPVLSEMALNVLSTGLNRDGSIRLCDVESDRRVVEMEFYFPVAGIDATELRRTLGGFGHGTPIEHRLAKLDFRISDGFMHGFVDLIFEANDRYFLVDYKSNWLGNEKDDYRLDRLRQEISRHDYYLQYLIYSVALHRYLAQKLPDYDYDRHFGGAFYLFVRGMSPDSGSEYGVFEDRPDRALMQRLELLFSRQGAVQ